MTPTTATENGRDRRWALLSGAAGLLADLLLVLFFALAQPFAARPGGAAWLGTANDWALVVQFAALVPVAAALGRRLPRGRGARSATAAAVVAAGAVALLQLLLVLGALSFEIQVVGVIAALIVVHGAVLAISLIGHRTATLPRPVTRLGLLLGAAYPFGLVLAAAGLLLAAPARWALLGPALVVGGAGYLALPLLPLLVARYVVPKEK